MAVQFEYYITGDDGGEPADGANWRAQTFTPAITHFITQVKLLVYRVNTPGTATVAIRATTNDLPSGANLASGTFDADTITTSSASEWVTVTLTTSIELTVSTKYAIVLSTSGSDPNYLPWRLDGSSPTYGGGNAAGSDDSGASWSGSTLEDHLFEELGNSKRAGEYWVEGSDWHYWDQNEAEQIVPGGGIVEDALFDANTILHAVSDDTPVAINAVRVAYAWGIDGGDLGFTPAMDIEFADMDMDGGTL